MLKNKLELKRQYMRSICSHGDSDHITGIKKVHRKFPISRIWDSDYPGTTTDSDEYREYMDLRQQLPLTVIKKLTRENFGRSRFRYISAHDDRLKDDANAQGIVLKVEHLDSESRSGNILSRMNQM
jgi:beta-lactamase superfamily II metal-dependent hydrolase